MKLIDKTRYMSHLFIAEKLDDYLLKMVDLHTANKVLEGFYQDVMDYPEVKEDEIRPTAKWIWNNQNKLWHVCSACKAEAFDDDCHGEYLSRYCPNCGVRMENPKE